MNQGTDFYAYLELFSNDIEFDVSDITFFGSVRRVYSSALAFNISVTIVPNGPTNDVVFGQFPRQQPTEYFLQTRWCQDVHCQHHGILQLHRISVCPRNMI